MKSGVFYAKIGNKAGVSMSSFSLTSQSVWDKLKNTSEPIIMYGTGNGADKVLDIFESMGISIDGVTASSGFVRERAFRGFPVKPIEYFEERLEGFTVVITFGSSIPQVMENIYKLSEKHNVLVPCVPVIENEICDGAFIEKNIEKIEKAYSLMADEASKKAFLGYLEFVFSGELKHLKEITTDENEVYENIIHFSSDEVFVDIGAYRGDTVEGFVKRVNGKYSKIVAAEPDKKTYNKLISNCEHLENFTSVNCAVTGFDGEIGFSQAGGRQSAIGGNDLIKSLSLNTLCENIEPSFIKIDSEGCEYEILSGGRDILKKYKPKLNVAAYHKFSDVFELPLLINEINPDYKIYLRHHPYIPAWDTLIYCV